MLDIANLKVQLSQQGILQNSLIDVRFFLIEFYTNLQYLKTVIRYFLNQNSAEVSILSPSSTSIPVIPPLDLNASESIKFSDSAIPAATTSKDIDIPIISNDASEIEVTSHIKPTHINASSHAHDGITEIVMMASLDTEVGQFKGISIFNILSCDIIKSLVII